MTTYGPCLPARASIRRIVDVMRRALPGFVPRTSRTSFCFRFTNPESQCSFSCVSITTRLPCFRLDVDVRNQTHVIVLMMFLFSHVACKITTRGPTNPFQRRRGGESLVSPVPDKRRHEIRLKSPLVVKDPKIELPYLANRVSHHECVLLIGRHTSRVPIPSCVTSPTGVSRNFSRETAENKSEKKMPNGHGADSKSNVAESTVRFGRTVGRPLSETSAATAQNQLLIDCRRPSKRAGTLHCLWGVPFSFLCKPG